MNIPFEFSVTYSGTPVLKKPFDNTDNVIFAAIVAAGSADDIAGIYGINVPTGAFWIESYNVTVSAACKIELGVYNGTTFVPLYTTFASEAIGGGIVRNLNLSSPNFPNTSSHYTQIRVTGAGNGTILVAGDLGIIPRS